MEPSVPAHLAAHEVSEPKADPGHVSVRVNRRMNMNASAPLGLNAILAPLATVVDPFEVFPNGTRWPSIGQRCERGVKLHVPLDGTGEGEMFHNARARSSAALGPRRR